MSEKKWFLEKKVKVLDAGHVKLCDYMGDDEAIVRCARQSYKKDKEELSENIISNRIEEMLKGGHSSPFEQVVFKFHLRVPIFVARQIVRHRTARMNELSGRYTEFQEDSFHVPNKDSFINRIAHNEHYESGEWVDAATNRLSNLVKDMNGFAFKTYKELLDHNIPRELARMVLPLNLYTEFYWQMDLHNLLHFLELRMEEHAQLETREFAYAIYYFVEKACPITIKHFTDFQLNKMVIGQKEIGDLVSIFNGNIDYNVPSDEEEDLIAIIKNKHNVIKHRNAIIKKRLEAFDEQLLYAEPDNE
jgi:thymidylate synthase (FAD)